MTCLRLDLRQCFVNFAKSSNFFLCRKMVQQQTGSSASSNYVSGYFDKSGSYVHFTRIPRCGNCQKVSVQIPFVCLPFPYPHLQTVSLLSSRDEVPSSPPSNSSLPQHSRAPCGATSWFRHRIGPPSSWLWTFRTSRSPRR